MLHYTHTTPPHLAVQKLLLLLLQEQEAATTLTYLLCTPCKHCEQRHLANDVAAQSMHGRHRRERPLDPLSSPHAHAPHHDFLRSVEFRAAPRCCGNAAKLRFQRAAERSGIWFGDRVATKIAGSPLCNFRQSIIYR